MKLNFAAVKTAIIATSLTVSSLSFAFQGGVPGAQWNESLVEAVKGDNRSDKNKARDTYRHPIETLRFFGFNEKMTVVEISPGGGWYTEILAPALKNKGQFYAAFYPDTGEDNYYSRTRRSFEKKMAGDDVYSKVKITDFTPRQANALAPAGSADLVLTFRNLHNWRDDGVKAVFKDAFKALKPGGVLGVVEHRLPDGVEASKRNAGYYSQASAVKFAKAAGFELEAASEINANVKDPADHEMGVWTLPPSFRLKDKDKSKYLAIGESDRMTLKFRKPNK